MSSVPTSSHDGAGRGSARTKTITVRLPPSMVSVLFFRDSHISFASNTIRPVACGGGRQQWAHLVEYSYNNDMNQLSPSTGLGARAVAPPVAQLNLNGTARLNRFGHQGPETAVQAFYHFFYNSHPFCLPEQRLLGVFKDRRAPLLEYAVQFIGSSFLPSVPTAMYKEALDRQINSGNYARDGWSVQAMLLFAIGLHAHNEVPRAAQIFALAQDLTLEIGLNRIEFALMNGENDPQLEESWRRTWWSMFTANGMMTAVNPGVQFRLKDIATDVPLPCENSQYFSGVSQDPCNPIWHLSSRLGNVSPLGCGLLCPSSDCTLPAATMPFWTIAVHE